MMINIPRPEYPRPDFERNQWLNLNGAWEFEFDDENIGEKQNWYKNKDFSKTITVPFCYQSKLSGINDSGLHEVMWYKRGFVLSKEMIGKRILLQFGAVDYEAKVWVNGEFVCSHKGGYVPFKTDVTRFLASGENTVVVRVEDRYDCTQPRGKQYWKQKPDRCWYTATSGIWQTVWLEAVGDIYFDQILITPDIDRKDVKLEIHLDSFPYETGLQVDVSFKGKMINSISSLIKSRVSSITLDIREEDNIDEIHYWTPDRPNLYDIKIKLSKDGVLSDEITSYFGMRKISVIDDRILLNNRVCYQKLILDQGYWEESLLTPPSDEHIRKDIELTKQLGFNGARKHQKIEDPRYYYWADRLGLLVWGEMPSAYEFNTEEIENVTKEWIDFIKRDYNHPCIITWVPFNESWGVRNIYSDKRQQNFVKTLYYLTKALDGTRLISSNDGWEQVQTDICAVHDYMASGDKFLPKYADKEKILNSAATNRMLFSEGNCYEGQPVMITEYGGIAFETEDRSSWGYNGMVKTEVEFLKRYKNITEAIRNTPYVVGYCYTQLTDVFQEVNGLLTMERKFKINPDEVKKINS